MGSAADGREDRGSGGVDNIVDILCRYCGYTV